MQKDVERFVLCFINLNGDLELKLNELWTSWLTNSQVVKKKQKCYFSLESLD